MAGLNATKWQGHEWNLIEDRIRGLGVAWKALLVKEQDEARDGRRRTFGDADLVPRAREVASRGCDFA